MTAPLIHPFRGQPCEGPALKVERAKHHFRELEALVGQFVATNPYQVRKELDAQTGYTNYLARVHADPPGEFALVLGDAIHNLRAALDLVWVQFVQAHLKRELRPEEQDKFPIHDSPAKFEAGLPNLEKRVHKDVLELLRQVRPYKGGNDALWRLHRLDIIDKHRLLLVLGASSGTMIETLPNPLDPDRAMRVEFNLEPVWPLNDGDLIAARGPIIAHAGFEKEADLPKMADPQFTLLIALCERAIIAEPEHLMDTLGGLVRAVQNVLNASCTLFP